MYDILTTVAAWFQTSDILGIVVVILCLAALAIVRTESAFERWTRDQQAQAWKRDGGLS